MPRRKKNHNKAGGEEATSPPAPAAKAAPAKASPQPAAKASPAKGAAPKAAPPAAAPAPAPAAAGAAKGGAFKFNFNFDNKIVPDLKKVTSEAKEQKVEEGDESVDDEAQGEDEDVIEAGEGMEGGEADMMRAALAKMMQARLEGLVGQPTGILDALPKKVKRRLGAIRKLLTAQLELEKQYDAEVRALEIKYQGLYAPIFDKRIEIITGKHEPADDEIEEMEMEGEDEEEEEPEPEPEPPKKGKKGGKKEEPKKEEPKGKKGGKKGGKPEPEPEEEEDDEEYVGVPQFWLSCLQNCPEIAEMITENDEEAMEALTDIRVEHLDENKGFRLTFAFAENAFFTNKQLTKTYYFSDDQVEVVFDRAEGCDIHWKKFKDLTKKGREPSFFAFFSPPDVPKEEELREMDPEDANMLGHQMQEDYSVGEIIKAKIVPRALLWFTGEAVDVDDMEDMDMFGDEEDDEEDDEEEEGHHGHSHGGHGGHGGGHGHSHGGKPCTGHGKKKGQIEEVPSDEDDDYVPPPAKPGEKPAECKQQ